LASALGLEAGITPAMLTAWAMPHSTFALGRMPDGRSHANIVSVSSSAARA
jgi:hypothetical protein